jgi:hypothetical protein
MDNFNSVMSTKSCNQSTNGRGGGLWILPEPDAILRASRACIVPMIPGTAYSHTDNDTFMQL